MTPNPPLDPTRDPAIIQQMLDNQAAELALRREDQEIRKQETSLAHDYAMKMLDAQVEDRQKERLYAQSTINTGCLVVGLVSFCITGTVAYALFLGKDALVMELLKTIINLVIGGIGGFSASALKKKKDEDGPKE